MKGTKKSLLASGAALLASTALLAGTTFAWFTDSVVNTGNRIEAGNLDIAATGFYLDGDHWDKGNINWGLRNPMFQETTWEPGQYNAVVVLVSNFDSNLAAKVDLDFSITKNDKNLADALWYKLTPVKQTYNNVDQAVPMDKLMKERPAKEGDLGTTGMSAIESETEEVILQGGQANGGRDCYVFYLLEYGMYTLAGNDYQNGSFGLDFTVKATQAPVETDGFGDPDYDADADYDAVTYVNNDFSGDAGDWTAGEVKDGMLFPVDGAYSRYGSYRSEYPGPWAASVDIYLDTAETEGNSFLLSNAVNGTDGGHKRDYIFTFRRIGERYVVLAGNNSDYVRSTDSYLDSIKEAEITETGWYTLTWDYSMVDGALACKMTIANRDTGAVVLTKTLSDPKDTEDVVGFNRYLWVMGGSENATFQTVPMDNQKLTVH